MTECQPILKVKRRCKKPVDLRLLLSDAAAGARRRLGGAKEVTREQAHG